MNFAQNYVGDGVILPIPIVRFELTKNTAKLVLTFGFFTESIVCVS